MPTDMKKTSYVQALHLKKVGLFLISLWVIVLIGGVGSTIYREIDGPAFRNVTAQNLSLNSINSTLSDNLTSANAASETTSNHLFAAQELVARQQMELDRAQTELAVLKQWYESYLASISADQAQALSIPFSGPKTACFPEGLPSFLMDLLWH